MKLKRFEVKLFIKILWEIKYYCKQTKAQRYYNLIYMTIIHILVNQVL